MTLKIEINAHPEMGPLAEQVEEAMSAIGFVRHIRTLEGSTAIPAPQPTVRNENVATGTEQFTDAQIAANAPTATRERGKPAAGRARRTKEEIAEDEAADADDAASSETKSNISTGEERVDPADVSAQDKADEAAEVETHRDAEKPLTIDDVKAIVNEYVAKFGMPAVQEDGPKIFVEALGKPPEGEAYWKMSLIPDDQDTLAKVVSIWKRCVTDNPLKRDPIKKSEG